MSYPQHPEWKLREHYSHSSLECYHQCPRKYQMSYMERWVPNVTARSLSFGDAVHQGLATWYRGDFWSDDQLREALVKIRTAGGQSTSDINKLSKWHLKQELMLIVAASALPEVEDIHAGDHRTHDLLDATLRAYTKVYEYEPWKVATSSSGQPYVEVDTAIVLPSGNILYCRLDLIIEFRDQILPVEHKTTSSIYNYGEQFSPNQQISIQHISLRGILDSDQISNRSMINAIQVARRKEGPKTEDFQRFPDVFRSPEELEEDLVDIETTISDIKADFERGYFPKHTNSCHSYGGCPFREVCSEKPEDRLNKLKAFYHQDLSDDPKHGAKVSPTQLKEAEPLA